MSNRVWFITGASRGFGRTITSKAMEAGDFAIASARHTQQLEDIVAQYGDRVFPVTLDVTDVDAVQRAFLSGVERFGRIDIVVNNAGYANISPIETMNDEDARRQFETNFWGGYNVSKAAIPIMRRQGGGVIIQFSSIGGRVGRTPGLAAYQAAKFAVDGFSRCLAVETAPFGIKVVVVEPSGFATDWAGSSMSIHEIPDEYESTVGMLVRMRRDSGLLTAGDPQRAAEILTRLARLPAPPSHLLLGNYAVDTAIDYSNSQVRQATDWAEVSRSADFESPFPTEFPI